MQIMHFKAFVGKMKQKMKIIWLLILQHCSEWSLFSMFGVYKCVIDCVFILSK